MLIAHAGTSIVFLIQFYSLVGFFCCFCATTKQIGGNESFEIKSSKYWVNIISIIKIMYYIRVHHFVDKEKVSTH